MKDGERQVSPTRAGIRRDHVARYEWAAKIIPAASRVADFACGVGYGTQLLALAGHRATGYDRDPEALAYARKHYAHANASVLKWDGAKPRKLRPADVAVCFETIEHLADPRPLLAALRSCAPRLIASVPNEDVIPFEQDGVRIAHHHRHYTPAQFEALLAGCGWRVLSWHGQAGPESEVEPDKPGRTILAVCERGKFVRKAPQQVVKAAPRTGKHIAIVGLGPSAAQYVSITRALGGRHQFCDETWVINAFGDVLAADLVFHMDDVRIQAIRAQAAPESNIAAMLRWMQTHPGPIVTSRSHPDYPGLVEFPLEDVVNAFPNAYFNSTAAYAIAYAVHAGVARISLFGCDFTYPDAHDAEKGRACCEFWLGMASERGIKLSVAKTSSLLDAMHPQAERFYGYDTVDLDIRRVGPRIVIGRTEKTALPSAEDIEARYDHSVHPNTLVERGHA